VIGTPVHLSPVLDLRKVSAPPVTVAAGPHPPTSQTPPDADLDDGAPRCAALLESWEAGLAVTSGLALLATLACAVLGSFALALLVLVAIAGIAGLITALL
jgi:hypothetical protein